MELTPIFDQTIRDTGVVPHPESLTYDDREAARLDGIRMAVVPALRAFMPTAGLLGISTGSNTGIIDAREDDPVPVVTRKRKMK